MERVAVLYGGPSPEHDVSVLTGLQTARVLTDEGYPTVGLYWGKSGTWHLAPALLEASDFLSGVPAGSEPLHIRLEGSRGVFYSKGRLGRQVDVEIDVVFNCCHGGPGEDGTIQAFFDTLQIPYTGPSARAAALGMDKYAFGATVAAAGLPTLPRLLASSGDMATPSFDPPWIMKPRFGGSSIGIVVVETLDEAVGVLSGAGHRHFQDGAVIEPYLGSAIDINVGWRSGGSPHVSAAERPERSADGAFYSYEEKYLAGEGLTGAARELPAKIDAATLDTLQSLTTKVAQVAGLRGVPRIDFLVEESGRVLVNEVNTIPGALGFYLWRAAGVSHGQLARDLVSEARFTPAQSGSGLGANGAALKRAGGIAAKLS